MKKIQTAVLKILPLIIILLSASLGGFATTSTSNQIKQADSLFAAKLYTQSFDLYHQLFLEKKYSEATLLKMAFIQEGLGHLSQSLYYLHLYYIISGDELALSKINEITRKYNLDGYEADETDSIFRVIQDNYSSIAGVIAAFAILFLSMFVYQKKKHDNQPNSLAFLSLLFLGILFAFANLVTPATRGIITASPVYLMKGPSSGAPVAAIVEEGHRLKILDRQDVWLKVAWKDEEVFIKENQVLKIALN